MAGRIADAIVAARPDPERARVAPHERSTTTLDRRRARPPRRLVAARRGLRRRRRRGQDGERGRRATCPRTPPGRASTSASSTAYLHIVQKGSTIEGKWERPHKDRWGELKGEVTGDLVKFTWTEYTRGLVGPNAKHEGKGYFKYKRPPGDNVDDTIVGRDRPRQRRGRRSVGRDQAAQRQARPRLDRRHRARWTSAAATGTATTRRRASPRRPRPRRSPEADMIAAPQPRGIQFREPPIFERGAPGRSGASLAPLDVPDVDPAARFGALARKASRRPPRGERARGVPPLRPPLAVELLHRLAALSARVVHDEVQPEDQRVGGAHPRLPRPPPA